MPEEAAVKERSFRLGLDQEAEHVVGDGKVRAPADIDAEGAAAANEQVLGDEVAVGGGMGKRCAGKLCRALQKRGVGAAEGLVAAFDRPVLHASGRGLTGFTSEIRKDDVARISGADRRLLGHGPAAPVFSL